MGKVVSGWKISNGKDWNLIGKKSPKEPQMFYPLADPELTFTKGDILAARCTMVIFVTYSNMPCSSFLKQSKNLMPLKKTFVSAQKNKFTEWKSSFGVAQNVWDWHKMYINFVCFHILRSEF